jgi:ribosomal protein L11 methyltransferase
LADRRFWPALVLRGPFAETDLLSATLDDHAPAAIEDLVPPPLPPGGLWDPTLPPPPEAPPAPIHWRVFFASTAQRDAAADAIRRALPVIDVEAEDVADEDWAAKSQQGLRAVAAGRFVVAPPWDVPVHPHPADYVIVIEPSRGFGTGHHPSTRLCLRALSELDVRGQVVLDLGTGSGVLAMAASLLGASRVIAVDVDPDAIDSARQSLTMNADVRGVDWVVGDFREPGWVAAHGGPWPVVLANLTGGMLATSAERIRELLAPGGSLIASGFDMQEAEGVRRALRLQERLCFVEDGWAGLVLRRLTSP